MKLVAWMAAGCAASAVAATAAAGTALGREILFGMLGPLAMASGSWLLMERTYKRNPAGLTSLMIMAFAVKAMFFAGYVAAMLTVLRLRPVPFVVSFTTYFIALHLTEALTMRRMFAGGV